jgi:hypothetical protein
MTHEPPYEPVATWPPPTPPPPPPAKHRGRWALAIIGALVVLAVIGAALPDKKPASTRSTVEQPLTGEHAYLAIMQAHLKPTVVSDTILLNAGHSVCDALDRGASVDEVATASLASSLPAAEIGYTMGAAIGTMCPSHNAELSAWIAAHKR